MAKMNVNSLIKKDYENEPPSGLKKQTQSKPISSKAKMNLKSLTGLSLIFLNNEIRIPGNKNKNV